MKNFIIVMIGFLLGIGISTFSDEIDSMPFADLDPLILTAFNYGMATGSGMAWYATTKNNSQACSFVKEHLTQAVEKNPNTKAKTDGGKMALIAAKINLELMLTKGLSGAGLRCAQ